MARIKLAPLVTDIAGSIGGVTFQRSRFGMIIRSKPLPIHSETSAQYRIRRLIASLQYSWQALTDAERLQWNRYLNFSGSTIRRDPTVLLSGHGLYLKYQLWRLMHDQPLLTSLAYAPMPDHFDLYRIEWDASPKIWLAFTGEVNKDEYFYICKLSSPRRETQAYSSIGIRWMVPLFVTTPKYEITGSYLSAFGALPVVGDYCHYAIRFFSMQAPVFTGVYTGKAKIYPKPG